MTSGLKFRQSLTRILDSMHPGNCDWMLLLRLVCIFLQRKLIMPWSESIQSTSCTKGRQ